MDNTGKMRRTPLALALLCGCGPSPSAATDSDGGASTSETDTGPTVEETTIATTRASDTDVAPNPGCECTRPGYPELYSYNHEACGWGPCGAIEFHCDGGVQGETLCDFGTPILDVEALDCALEQLRTGTPGLVTFVRALDLGQAGGYVRIREGRTGLSRTWLEYDLSANSSELAVVTLREATYFAGCQAMPDPMDRFSCLIYWSQSSAIEVCDGPISYGDGDWWSTTG